MKILRTLVIAMALFLIPAYAYSASLGDLRVNYLDGDVQVKTEDTPDWVPASINMPLVEGDALWVPEGARAAVQLRDGTSVRVDENSSLEILAVGGDSSQFYLSLGHAYVNFKGRRGGLLQMDTPVSSVRAYDIAKFRVDVAENGLTDVSVLSGSVTTETRNGKTRVAAGRVLSVGDDAYAELFPLGPADGWERWNRDMDGKFDRRYASSYLPTELYSYSADFEGNGKWVSTSEYGYVWTPTVVSVDWAPYRNGRWAWRGGDYVWISYDPWGWAPYHYGRWAFGVSLGWYWVPPRRGDVYWGPGYVGWVNTGTYVGWVPLAPGETYYGHGYYGHNSVNVVNININTINVRNVYRNAHVTNAATIVSHDTFVTGRRGEVRMRENLFLTRNVSVGRPDISPTRTSYMPVVKTIPASKEPPRRIRQIQVDQLRESRPVVKNPNESVLRPGTTVRQIAVPTGNRPRVPGVAVQPQGLQPRSTEVQKRSAPADRKAKSTEIEGVVAPQSSQTQRGVTQRNTETSKQKPEKKKEQKQDTGVVVR
jgi:hypothetical protein